MHPKTVTVLFYASILLVAMVAFFTTWVKFQALGWFSLFVAFVAMVVYYALFAVYFNWRAKVERRYDMRFSTSR